MLYAFEGISRPIVLPRGRVVEVLSAVLHDWGFTPLDGVGSGDPLIRLTESKGRYRLESPWQEGPPRDRNAVNAVCAFLVDLVHAFVADNPSLLCLHCAAADIGGRLVIIPATYRSGKSTLMASLAAAGTRVHADDVDPDDQLPEPGRTRRAIRPEPGGVQDATAPRIVAIGGTRGLDHEGHLVVVQADVPEAALGSFAGEELVAPGDDPGPSGVRQHFVQRRTDVAPRARAPTSAGGAEERSRRQEGDERARWGVHMGAIESDRGHGGDQHDKKSAATLDPGCGRF